MARTGRLVALAVALMTMSSPGQAQVPEQRGFFGHIDGRWMWLGGDRIETAQVTDARITSGPGGQMLLGYKITDNWDVALAGDIQSLITQVTQLRGGTLTTDTNHQHVDLEVGYSERWWRVNFGLRGIHFLQTAAYNVPGFAGYDQRDMYGIGPKLGLGARWELNPSWAVIGGVDGALVYTSFADTGTGALIGNGSYWQFVPQVGGELGLSWRSADTPSFSFTVGARIDASFNTAITADGMRRGTLFEYGPFVRIAYNFAGPARVTPQPVPEAAAGAAAPSYSCSSTSTAPP